MNRYLLISFNVLLIGLAPAAVSHAKDDVDQLDWLGGCWSMESGSRTISEQWMRPSGGMVIGMSRTVSNGQTVAYEFLTISNKAEGGVELVARPSGQPEAAFTMMPGSNGEATFENPTHDFPQRIIYRATGRDTLYARIEGTLGGKERAVDFPMKRMSCP